MFVQSSLAARVLALLALVTVAVVAISVALAYGQAERRVEQAAASKVTNTALALAATDDVREGLAASDPAAVLGPFAERSRVATGTDFVVIMSASGVRYTHPNPALVGGQFAGTIADAQAGGVVVENYEGSLGPSTRAVVPVLVDGQVRGLVSVGLVRARIATELQRSLPDILLPGLAAAVLSGAGALMVARGVRRETLGLNAAELRRLHDHHEAVLHAVREGLVITDTGGRLQVVNDEAQRLLAVSPSAIGKKGTDLGFPAALAELLARGRRSDVPVASSGRVLLVSSGEVVRGGKVVATLTTLRDRTELEELTGQLSTTKSLADALHAQAHEAANRLHTVTTLIELGRPDDAVAFATAELRASHESRRHILTAIGEPAVAALLLGKVAQAAEAGITLDLDPDAHLPADVVPAREAVLILGNLIDNAIEALGGVAAPSERQITVDAEVSAESVLLTVADTGPGLGDGAGQAFQRGWTTKRADAAQHGLGLSLVAQTVRLLGGTVRVADGPGATFVVELPLPPRTEAADA